MNDILDVYKQRTADLQVETITLAARASKPNFSRKDLSARLGVILSKKHSLCEGIDNAIEAHEKYFAESDYVLCGKLVSALDEVSLAVISVAHNLGVEIKYQ